MMGMSRKVQMGKVWREGHRRSPRISALDAWKPQAPAPPPAPSPAPRPKPRPTATTTTDIKLPQHQKQHHPHRAGPASRTRANKKRKLRPLQDVASSTPNAPQDPKSIDVEHVKKPSHEDQHPSKANGIIVQDEDQNPRMPCALWIPEKRILQLIIDILQRRDTHEIFAEPVDPNEVEDYYEIIKEPMDFGTMRAKLHEGMYRSLEQFEHDVFLISRNAMHFNSTGTIYFRQARAIDELAKKVFHVLKTNPENFELEFSVMRRRSGRRPQGEARGSTYGSSTKVATGSRSNSITFSASSKSMSSSAGGSTNLRRTVRAKPSYPNTATHYDERDEVLLFGGGDVRDLISYEAERRSTCKPWTSFLSDNHAIVSTIYNNSKVLTHLNQPNIGYRKSLMSFIKDLGPTAQMVAKRKLSGWSTDAANFLTARLDCWPKASDCQDYAASTSAQSTPSTSCTATTIETSYLLHPCERMGMGYPEEREAEYAGNKMGIHGSSVVVVPNKFDNSSSTDVRGDGYSRDGMDVVAVAGTEKFQPQNGGIGLVLHSSMDDARDPNFIVSGLHTIDSKVRTLKLEESKVEDGSRSSDLGFKSYTTNALRYRLDKNDDLFFSSSHTPYTHCLRGSGEVVPNLGVNYSTETISGEEGWRQASSPFTFDLPFLKKQLDQIKWVGVGQDIFTEQSSRMEMGHPNEVNGNYNYNDNHGGSTLALQL